MEQGCVNAWRYYFKWSAICAIESGDVVLFDMSGYNDGVGSVDNLVFGVCADLGFALACARALLGAGHGVECGDVGCVPSAAQFDGDDSRKPVVAVNERVFDALALLKAANGIDESGCVRVQVFLWRIRGTRVEMDDTGAVCDGDYLRLVEFVGASEDIDLIALRGEFAGELANIYVHASGVLLAEPPHRTTMEAYQS